MGNIGISLTLIGGPTVLIDIHGFRLLTDPTFDPPGNYRSGRITLRKNKGPAIGRSEIGNVDAVLLSHDQHYDNLDHGGRAFLAEVRTVFTTPAGAHRLGGYVKGLEPWETKRIEQANGAAIHITAAPARHGPVGIEPLAGDVTGFLVGVRRPGDSIYITGDTVWYPGIAEVAKRHNPSLVMLFTGSAKPRGPFRLTMDSNDAIEAAHAFPEARIVAVHNQGWDHFTESEDDVGKAFAAVGIDDRLQKLPVGGTVSLDLEP